MVLILGEVQMMAFEAWCWCWRITWVHVTAVWYTHTGGWEALLCTATWALMCCHSNTQQCKDECIGRLDSLIINKISLKWQSGVQRGAVLQGEADLWIFLILGVPVQQTQVGPVEDGSSADRTLVVSTSRLRLSSDCWLLLWYCHLKPSCGIVQRS